MLPCCLWFLVRRTYGFLHVLPTEWTDQPFFLLHCGFMSITLGRVVIPLKLNMLRLWGQCRGHWSIHIHNKYAYKVLATSIDIYLCFFSIIWLEREQIEPHYLCLCLIRKIVWLISYPLHQYCSSVSVPRLRQPCVDLEERSEWLIP